MGLEQKSVGAPATVLRAKGRGRIQKLVAPRAAAISGADLVPIVITAATVVRNTCSTSGYRRRRKAKIRWHADCQDGLAGTLESRLFLLANAVKDDNPVAQRIAHRIILDDVIPSARDAILRQPVGNVIADPPDAVEDGLWTT